MANIEAVKQACLPNIDQETLKWLRDFCAWKRGKFENIELFRIGYILEYLDTHAIDYFFITRNYDQLKALLLAYSETYGEVEGITRLIADLGPSLGAEQA